MTTYEGAGVNIEAGEQAVDRIKPHVARTERPGVAGGIGGFGGMFNLAAAGHEGSMLVSSTDGVGTKALVATMTGRFDTIGIDLVAMCVDDLVCQGAEPLFFLDYVSVGSLDIDHMEALVSGVAEGCAQANCALIGGEMAEHPGVMDDGEFDLVGFSVGAVASGRVIDGTRVEVGDVVVGIESPNLRSNGFSLARKLMFEVAGKSIDDPPGTALKSPSVKRCSNPRSSMHRQFFRLLKRSTCERLRTSPVGDCRATSTERCHQTWTPRSIPPRGRSRRSSPSFSGLVESKPPRCSVRSTWV